MMLVTVWVFIGIEGASIYSRRAARRADVGRATVIGFLGVWLLLVLVSLLSMGVLSQAELAGLPNPSMAYVLRAIVGEWGATVIIVGSIIRYSARCWPGCCCVPKCCTPLQATAPCRPSWDARMRAACPPTRCG